MLDKRWILVLFCTFLLSSIAYAQKKKTTSFFFETNIDVLGAPQKEVFSHFISELESSDIISIAILGYCDDRGTKNYNDTLSIRRAEHIKLLLKDAGVSTDKVALLIGNGKINLKAPENIDEQRTYNRRVDLEIEYVQKNSIADNPIISDNLKVGDIIVLENILFENSKSVLLEESIPVLEKITALIIEKKQYNIAILGHICCNPPGRDVKDFRTGVYNLSQARAKMIYDYLIYKGVHSSRLTYKGMRANYPLGKGEKADRRVELQITGINHKNK